MRFSSPSLQCTLVAALVATSDSLSVKAAPPMAAGIRATIDQTKAACAARSPFSERELDAAVLSLQQLAGPCAVDWSGYRSLLEEVAHEPHTDWVRTEAAAERLATLLGGPGSETFDALFERVLEDGGWAGASAAAEKAPRPWVVLVTGVNGIRKTTSIYQEWFQQALSESLAATYPAAQADAAAGLLPDGGNSFFRQLDYMVATLACEEFRPLYADAADAGGVALYAELKDAIFSRYRTVAEMLGVLLVRAAQARRMNVMVETSGRDVASFLYVDHLFPDDAGAGDAESAAGLGAGYHKLVVHFEINDLAHAEASVGARMEREVADGKAALATHADDVAANARAVIRANAGGPYGPAALKGVQAASQAVWETVRAGGGAGAAWHKASIEIEAHATEEWTVRAGGGAGRVHRFVRR